MAFAAGLLAALAAGLLTTALLTRLSHTQTMVVATQNLPPYTTIEPSDVKTVTVPTDPGIVGLAANPSAVIGKYLMYPVPKGFPVTAGSVSDAYSFSAFLTQYVKKTGVPGMELAVPVTSATESLVEPGEAIALIMDNRSDTGTMSVQTIAPVLVLNRLVPASGNSASSLLLFIPEQDYNTVAQAVLANSFTVGLIPQNGAFVAPGSAMVPTISQATPPSASSSVSVPLTQVSDTHSAQQISTGRKEAHHGTHA